MRITFILVAISIGEASQEGVTCDYVENDTRHLWYMVQARLYICRLGDCSILVVTFKLHLFCDSSHSGRIGLR